MSSTLSPLTTLTPLYLDASWPAPSSAQVAVAGEVDLGNAHLLRERLLGVLRENAPAVLHIDLAGVTFLDCAGIGALVAVRNAAIRAGAQMRVSHTQPIVRRVLGVTGLLDLFTAPVDEPMPTGSDHPSRIGTATAPATEPPGVLAAA